MDNDIPLFRKSPRSVKDMMLSELFRDIYQNSTQKHEQIETTISELRPLIKTTSDAIIIVPLIKEYLDVSVRNDEHLIKLAAVVNRFVDATTPKESGNEVLLSEEEKKQLLDSVKEEVDNLKKSTKGVAKQIKGLNDKVDETLPFSEG